MLVVVTPRASVAAWARQPLSLGHPNGAIHPVVIGPSLVPIIKDKADAIRAPELAVLSAIMHGKSDDGADVARAAITAASRLDDQTATLYTDIILLSLRASARAIIEELMANGTYQYRRFRVSGGSGASRRRSQCGIAMPWVRCARDRRRPEQPPGRQGRQGQTDGRIERTTRRTPRSRR
jgi:hypothetical protein